MGIIELELEELLEANSRALTDVLGAIAPKGNVEFTLTLKKDGKVGTYSTMRLPTLIKVTKEILARLEK